MSSLLSFSRQWLIFDASCKIFSTYSQLSPCGHPAITNTTIIRTAAKSPAKTSCRRLTEINSRYYGLSLMRTPPRGPYSVRYKRSRLQNSPYFCVFKYARAVKQKVWNEAANREQDWGETLKISFASHALRACEARALGARKTLTPRFTDFFTDFEKKTDFFAVYKRS